MYKTYIVGIIFILFGITGVAVDLIEGRTPKFEVYFEYILMGFACFGIRLAIKKIPA